MFIGICCNAYEEKILKTLLKEAINQVNPKLKIYDESNSIFSTMFLKDDILDKINNILIKNEYDINKSEINKVFDLIVNQSYLETWDNLNLEIDNFIKNTILDYINNKKKEQY